MWLPKAISLDGFAVCLRAAEPCRFENHFCLQQIFSRLSQARCRTEARKILKSRDFSSLPFNTDTEYVIIFTLPPEADRLRCRQLLPVLANCRERKRGIWMQRRPNQWPKHPFCRGERRGGMVVAVKMKVDLSHAGLESSHEWFRQLWLELFIP